ncbi:hypothetical protein ASD11_01305 [Aeromicrobium sp. Root495]|nr:hypothetical protein ASD11_01305 [Aeromicrobium sp. Root495]
MCGVEHVEHERTCPSCIHSAKERLRSVYGLNKHLDDQALHGVTKTGRLIAALPIPGGDAVVLTGPGSQGDAEIKPLRHGLRASSRPADRSHELRGEPLPTRRLLQQWEDVWRAELGAPYEGPVSSRSSEPGRSLLSTAKFLIEHVSWAAQRTESFPDFVREVARHAALLEVLLNDGVRPEAGAAPCFRCAGDLERHAADPLPCAHALAARKVAKRYDEPGFTTVHLLRYAEQHLPEWYAEHRTCQQGGTSDTYVCARCHWRYDQQAYWLTVREEFERAEAARRAEQVVELAKELIPEGLAPHQEAWLRSMYGPAGKPAEPTSLADPGRRR